VNESGNLAENAREHTLEIVVAANEIDSLGHVNNAVYVQYLEMVATAHAERLGMGLEVLRSLEAIPVIREHHLKYLRPAKLGDVLTVHTRVEGMQGVRATRRNTISLGETVLLESFATWVWLHPVTWRPRAIPDVIWRAFGF
jgi:acyl-CoA thioester hydrolase